MTAVRCERAVVTSVTAVVTSVITSTSLQRDTSRHSSYHQHDSSFVSVINSTTDSIFYYSKQPKTDQLSQGSHIHIFRFVKWLQPSTGSHEKRTLLFVISQQPTSDKLGP